MDCPRTNPKVKSCAEVLGNISLVLVDHRILMPASVQRRIPNYMSFSVASLARGQAAPGDWIAVVAAIPRSPPRSTAHAAVVTAAHGPLGGRRCSTRTADGVRRRARAGSPRRLDRGCRGDS